MDFTGGALRALVVAAFTTALLASNQLAAQGTPQTIATYQYNSKGQRISKTVGGVTTTFDYDEAGHLISERSPSGSRDYIYLGDILINTVDTQASPTNTQSTISYVTTDHQGTPRVVSDSGGNVIWQNPYQGNSFEEQQPSSNGYILNIRGRGEYYDAETGLNYNGQRYRDPTTWRFLQSDPKGLVAGINTYAATNNNPLMWVDPTGLQTSMDACLLPQNAEVCAVAGMLPQGAGGAGAGAAGGGATLDATSAAANSAAIGGALGLSWAAEHAPDKACPATNSNWDNDNRDKCENQRNRDESDCSVLRGTGPEEDPNRWYRACMVRASDRFGLCMKGAGTMPPPWSFKDME